MRWRAGFMIALSLLGPSACDIPRAAGQGSVPGTPPSSGGASETPSEQLDRSRGVIKPRNDVDPKMQVRPPDPGPTSTPVIPPPGSPGGDPKVVPK